MFRLSNHWEPLDMCYMWVCWLWKVRNFCPSTPLLNSFVACIPFFSLLIVFGCNYMYHLEFLSSWFRYKGGHAIIHWKETQHCYSLEVETKRVWDYVGDNYVHRLIQSKTDGKLVELNSHCVHADSGSCGDNAMREAILNSKVEAVMLQFSLIVFWNFSLMYLYNEFWFY